MKMFFLRNPWFRTFFPLTLVSFGGFFANTLVTEISNNSSINWRAIPSTCSFWLLLLVTIFTGIYQVVLFKNDNFLLQIMTGEEYEAFIRKSLAKHIKAYLEDLVKKRDWDQLERETERFKRLFGNQP